MATKRIGWVDAAKGIAIIAVIIYHTNCSPAIIHSLMGSFQIPLFFFLAGYTFHVRSVGETARRSMPRLLIPWAVLSAYGSMAYNLAGMGYAAPDLVLTTFKAMLLNVSYSVTGQLVVGASWFLLALFGARLMLAFVAGRLDGSGHPDLILLVASVAAGAVSIALSLWSKVAIPLNLPAVLMGFAFMGCGHCARRMGLFDFEERSWGVSLRFVLALALWVACMPLSDMDLGYGYYRGLAVAAPLGALAASVAICTACVEFERRVPALSHVLEAVGQRSMAIYCVHAVEIVGPWSVLDPVAALPMGWVLVLAFRVALDFCLALHV